MNRRRGNMMPVPPPTAGWLLRGRATHPRFWSPSLALVCLCLCGLVLGGCGGGYQEPPLPVLHLPGVQPIPGIDTLHTRLDRGVISGITAYATIPAAPARVLVTLDGVLYDVGLNGSDLHRVPLACGSPVTTPDGQWLACESHQGLLVAPLIHPEQALQIPTGPGDVAWYNPSWLDDGSTLAALTQHAGCSIVLLAPPTPQRAAQVRAEVVLPPGAFTSVAGGCGIQGLALSPDGAWLAFVDNHDPSRYGPVYVLALSRLLPQVPPPPAPFSSHETVQVPMEQLIPLDTTRTIAAPSWSHVGGAWTVTFANEENELVRVDPLTKQQATLLVVPYGKVTAVAWTPDGQHLLFVQTADHCGDCAPPVPESRLYVYTPPSATPTL